MQLFFSNRKEGHFVFLDEDEAKHATQVLRKKVGDVLDVFDGAGNQYQAEIESASKKEVKLKVLNQVFHEPEKSEIHLFVAPTKNMDRIEWLVEKCIEVGVSSINMVLCTRSERKQVNLERIRKIALSAAKQSLSFHLPLVNEIKPFKDVLDFPGEPFIAVCDPTAPRFSAMKLNPGKYALLIGPEGDFTPEEIQLAKQKKWKESSLGTKRLRTETAALTGVMQLNFLLND